MCKTYIMPSDPCITNDLMFEICVYVYTDDCVFQGYHLPNGADCWARQLLLPGPGWFHSGAIIYCGLFPGLVMLYCGKLCYLYSSLG